MESCISSRLESLDPKMDIACVRLRNTFANHSRLCLRCVDQCACVFRPSAAVLAVLVFLPGLCAAAGRSTLATVLQVTNFVESLLLGSQTILFSRFYPSTFPTCIGKRRSSLAFLLHPGEVAHLEAFDRTTFRPRVISLTSYDILPADFQRSLQQSKLAKHIL